jgi:hypothetical protein
LTHKGGFLYSPSHLKQVLITDHAHRAAVQCGLRNEEKAGSQFLMGKMIYGPWDKEFILARPGETIILDQFLAGSSWPFPDRAAGRGTDLPRPARNATGVFGCRIDFGP